MKKTKISSAKKKGPDRVEVLVKEHLANAAAAEDLAPKIAVET